MSWVEGIPPSIVDDNVRALMARVAEYRDDISGSLTFGGTLTAYTLTTNQGLATPTPTTGQLIGFVPNVTNGNAPTLAVDGGSNYPIQTSPGVAIGGGVLVQGTPYTAMFSGAAWLLRNFYGNPFNVPVAGAIPYFAATAPNSSFALPFGQAISRTTFSTLFSLIGTTYGVGDGTTTFNLPNARGCTFAFLDNMGGTAMGRIGTALVTDGGTINGQQLGSFGGSQSHVQTLAELVTHNHPITDPGHAHSVTQNAQVFNFQNLAGGGSQTVNPTAATITVNSNTTGISVNNQGSSNAMAWLQPTMVVNCILRII
jgi:microcystin-dependent protein